MVIDPRNPELAQAMRFKCPVCHVDAGEPCINLIHPGLPLPGRVTHIGRTLSGYTAQEGTTYE